MDIKLTNENDCLSQVQLIWILQVHIQDRNQTSFLTAFALFRIYLPFSNASRVDDMYISGHLWAVEKKNINNLPFNVTKNWLMIKLTLINVTSAQVAPIRSLHTQGDSHVIYKVSVFGVLQLVHPLLVLCKKDAILIKKTAL